ncbi:Mo-dependent nitrogenase C-terminal domain-containing protein [Microseira wollei]|uniref:Mo-dependent nitrogenase C-terminal domain-containing protein n=1 Tax=Microseira wollei TaxID=467598 RepID=UPI001CFE5090|nr:Mo-dependent nitrogenase C-terminal domain-containing protein [Microseira wollei]
MSQYSFITLITAALHPIRQKLDAIEVQDSFVAHTLCKLMLSRCPFERKIQLFNYHVLRQRLCNC